MKQSKKNNRQPKPIQVQLNPDDLPDVKCKCGNKTFIEGKTMKKLSEIHPANQSRKAQYLHSAVAICIKCFEPLPHQA